MDRIPVSIIGLGAEGPAGLHAEARRAIAGADFLAGGRRHLELIGPTRAETWTITADLEGLSARLARRGAGERCIVLASGDPLLFGIGRYLASALGREAIRVEPATSSLALAFARAGLSWEDATLASVHGRDLAATLMPLIGRPKIGLLTRDGRSPSEIAAFFADRGAPSYRAWVCEDLGSEAEAVSSGPVADLQGRTVSDLNVVILERESALDERWSRDRVPILPDHAFAQPETGPILLTHSDVRALTLARFSELPPGPIWDVGAGLGGVSIELARAFADREVVAIERSESTRALLAESRARFECYNMRIVAGEAPDALESEPAPAAVFIGGSGGRLDAILALAMDRLVPGGVLVANFVGVENLATMLGALGSRDWGAETTQVQVAGSRRLGGLTTFLPLRPVWIVRSGRP